MWIKKVGFIYASLYVFTTLFACGKTKENVTNKEEERENVFRAGASIVDITGSLSSNYVVHDKLHARTLVLDDGLTKLVFVVVDEQVVPREVFEEAKKLILTENKINPKNILMSATHTHSAGSRASGSGITGNGYSVKYSWNLNRKLDTYQAFLAKQIATGVRNAVLNLEPAKIGWSKVDVPQWTFNRRWLVEEPIVNPYGGFDKVASPHAASGAKIFEAAGPVDPEVSFISVKAMDGRPISVFANYSTHYAGGVPENHISADYFSVFSDSMKKLLKVNNSVRPFVGIMSNGTSADINTTNRKGGQPTFSPYEKMKVVADDIAQAIFSVYQNLEHKESVSLQAMQIELILDIRRADRELLDHVASVLEKPSSAPLRHPRERDQANYVMQLEKEWPNSISVPLQVFKLNDLAISAIPFEVFAENGLEIKEKTPFKNTFTIGLGNGWFGYLPTPEQHELGGWETWMGGSNKVQINASELVVERILDMHNLLL